MMKTVLAAACALLLAACVSTPAHPPAPTAAHLAREIPGVYGCGSQPPSVLATADEECRVRDGDGPGIDNGLLQVATFKSGSDETEWIQQNNSYACCVQGNGWAATYNPGTSSKGFSLITGAIGGRVTSG